MGQRAEDPQRDARWLAEIAAAGAQGRAALWALSTAYNPAFLALLKRKGLNLDEAERVLDETWVRVVKRAPSFDPRAGTPAALIWTIFTGEANRGYKTHRRDQDRLSFGDIDEGEGVPDAPDVPMWARPAERDVMLWRCVRKAMEALWRDDPEGAELLWLRAVDEWKPEELAAVDGRVVGTIKNVLSRVRKAAAELLKPCYEGREPHR